MSKDTKVLPPLTAEEVHLIRNGLVQYMSDPEEIIKRHHKPDSDWFIDLMNFKAKTEALLQKLPDVLTPKNEEPRFLP